MAVGVMELVPGRASGVAFSMHPVTGARDRIVLESAPGLAGAVVTGRLDPERLEIDKGDGRVLRRHPGGYGAAEPVLAAREIDRVVDAVRRAEDLLGHPVDLEWAVDAQARVWVLQARPVTAAESGSADRDADGDTGGNADGDADRDTGGNAGGNADWDAGGDGRGSSPASGWDPAAFLTGL
jgi:pyruvate,water dikinase